MLSLFFRNLFFTTLQPGVVTLVVPYFIVKHEVGEITLSPATVNHWVGIALFLIGWAVVIYCVSQFAIKGKGTLSPVDPTQALVTSGLYQYSRNPMYVGVLSVLIGEVIFFSSVYLTWYTFAIAVAFHLFVVYHEEPRLWGVFGEAYEEYCSRVGRWI